MHAEEVRVIHLDRDLPEGAPVDTSHATSQRQLQSGHNADSSLDDAQMETDALEESPAMKGKGKKGSANKKRRVD